MLASHADQLELAPLLYPLTQLLLGCARLVPTPRYFPLRLRCVAMLNSLARATKTYIPVGAVLLEMLSFSGFHKKATSPGSAHDFGLVLRVSKGALRSAKFQEMTMELMCEALVDHLDQWSTHVSFPELGNPNPHHFIHMPCLIEPLPPTLLYDTVPNYLT